MTRITDSPPEKVAVQRWGPGILTSPSHPPPLFLRARPAPAYRFRLIKENTEILCSTTGATSALLCHSRTANGTSVLSLSEKHRIYTMCTSTMDFN